MLMRVTSLVRSDKESLRLRNVPRLRSEKEAGHWWLTPVILATQDVETKRIAVRRQPVLKEKTGHGDTYLSPQLLWEA
jgi:hypothetical protein